MNSNCNEQFQGEDVAARRPREGPDFKLSSGVLNVLKCISTTKGSPPLWYKMGLINLGF